MAPKLHLCMLTQVLCVEIVPVRCFKEPSKLNLFLRKPAWKIVAKS